MVRTIDDYIIQFPPEVRVRLELIRDAIRQIAPEAVEGIAYGMPAYKLNKRPLVYFAAFEHHIGFYATPSGHKEFAADLSKYKQGKGSVQFPHKLPLPLELIERMILFRVDENFKYKKR